MAKTSLQQKLFQVYVEEGVEWTLDIMAESDYLLLRSSDIEVSMKNLEPKLRTQSIILKVATVLVKQYDKEVRSIKNGDKILRMTNKKLLEKIRCSKNCGWNERINKLIKTFSLVL